MSFTDTLKNVVSKRKVSSKSYSSFLRAKSFQNFVAKIPASFAKEHLTIVDVIHENIFLDSALNLGVVYEFDGIYDEPLLSSDLEKNISRILNSIVDISNGVPAAEMKQNVVIQFFCSQREIHHPPEKIHNYKSYRFKESSLGKLLAEDERALFKDVGLLKRRFFLAIKVENKASKTRGNLLDFFKKSSDLAAIEEKTFDKKIKELQGDLVNLESLFPEELKLRRWKKKDYLGFVQDCLNAGKFSHQFDDDLVINESIYQTELEDKGDHLLINHNNSMHPFYISQGDFKKFKVGQMRVFFDALPCSEWDFVWTYSHGTGYVDSGIASTGAFYRRYNHGGEGENFEAFESQVNPRSPYGLLSMKLNAYNIDKNTVARIKSVSLSFLGARAVQEEQLAVHHFASSLPLNCSKDANNIKCRYRTIRLQNATLFLPIYSGPKNNHGTVFRPSRMATPTRYDLFAGQGNRMTTVLATSRSGKSVFTNLHIMEFLERFPQGIVRVLDKKTSYQKLADICNGRIINFSEEELRNKAFSPFALDQCTNDDIESLFILISTVIFQKNQDIHFSGIHEEILRESIKLAYFNHQKSAKLSHELGSESDPHPIFRDLLSQMPVVTKTMNENGIQGVSEAKEDLAKWTVNLYETGSYGFLFSRHQEKVESTKDEQILVYDLDKQSDPVLAQIASMMAVIRIQRDIASIPLSTPKLIILEEFGMLLHGNSETQKILESFTNNMVKTIAKYNGIVFAITNNVDDYAQKPAGRNIWEIALQKIFLPLGNLYDSAHETWKDSFNKAEWQILKSLELQKEFKRSMAYIKSMNADAPYEGSIFIPLTPLMDAITSTSASQLEYYKQKRNEGFSAFSAIQQMAQKHPYGEGFADE